MQVVAAGGLGIGAISFFLLVISFSFLAAFMMVLSSSSLCDLSVSLSAVMASVSANSYMIASSLVARIFTTSV